MAGDHAVSVDRACRRRWDVWAAFWNPAGRMSFGFRSDVGEHEVFGKLSLAAFGLWAMAGTWTSAHQSPAFVP